MRLSFTLLSTLFALPAFAHALPDIPVRGVFKSDRSATIEVEIDPRCFAADAEHAPYLKKHDFEDMSPADREKLIDQSRALVEQTLQFRLEPKDLVKPDFEYSFVERPDAIPDSDPDGGIPIMVVARWTTKLPQDLKTYQLRATDKGRFSIHFLNKVGGVDQKVSVLFPGESSYKLDLSKLD